MNYIDIEDIKYWIDTNNIFIRMWEPSPCDLKTFEKLKSVMKTIDCPMSSIRVVRFLIRHYGHNVVEGRIFLGSDDIFQGRRLGVKWAKLHIENIENNDHPVLPILKDPCDVKKLFFRDARISWLYNEI